MESDAERLSSLMALGGESVVCATGSFTAIFDNDYIAVGEVEERGPGLTVRTSDVTQLLLRKGTVLTIQSAQYRIRRHEPDGTGMSRLILEAA